MVEFWIVARCERGLSLIEMLIVLLIIGILALFSPLAFHKLLKKNQIDVTVDEIKMAIQFSKINALSQAHPVILTPISGEMNWSEGMALCVDNPLHQCVSNHGTIREWHWFHNGIEVNWLGFESNHYLRFSPDLMGRAANGYFMVKDQSNQPVKLIVNRLGRVRVSSE